MSSNSFRQWIMLFQVLVICGFSATPGFAAPPSVAPCSLISTSEVEEAVGPLKGTPVGDKEGDAAWCSYEFANGKDFMEVWVFPAESY